MGDIHENEKIDIDLKIREAETYRSQELFAESLEIYEEILSVSTELDSDIGKTIQEKIALLKEEIERLEKEAPSLSDQDISYLKETLDSEETAHAILTSASSLKELGLFREAVEEYTKLFDKDYPIVKIIGDLSECLFAIHSPSRVINHIEQLIKERDLSDQEKSDIKFKLGAEMEKQGHADLAIELYESVKNIDPEYEGIQTRTELLQSSRTYDSKYSYLLESKLVTTSQLQNALAISKKTKRSVEYVLMEQNRIEKEKIGKSLSLFFNCPFTAFSPDMPVPYELLTKLKRSFLLQYSWVPLNWEMTSGTVDILIDDPTDLIKTDHIAALIYTNNINYFVGIKEDIAKIIKYFFDKRHETGTIAEEDVVDSFDIMPDIDFEEDEDDEIVEEFDESSSQVVRMVDQIFISAYRKNVSDIHIEPSPMSKTANIRFRIDGVCQDFLQVPITHARAILSRIKIMSRLDIAEKRLPQDGKIKFKRKGIKPFELRIATIPTVGGYEDAVLRILEEAGARKLDDVALNEKNLKTVKKVISQPTGLFLVVGPTGSGKTTTLHSALGYINKPEIKIWTAEDPVEITQLGLRQVQCQFKIGLDFARIMRAFLRADPDVIMIGEMRDKETASIAVEASLTGHLVFSTLHTNNAPETVTRLLDMGINPLNFSDAFQAVLAQRLARVLCNKCRKKYHPSDEDIYVIKTLYGKEHFDSSGLELTPDTVIYQTEGCDDCYETGYKGRLGIHELMEGTKEIKRMIKKEATPEELFIQASNQGMTTLVQDGIVKVLEGLTDITEIQRVCVS
ncbi:MAG: Flp pilus assembly complex ATPase component TadA [Deltaproteobacteria bacterium]|nr:Flp pilus assembly complex ATPase component TadA [Deltaproteobacteria bacterium]